MQGDATQRQLPLCLHTDLGTGAKSCYRGLGGVYSPAQTGSDSSLSREGTDAVGQAEQDSHWALVSCRTGSAQAGPPCTKH